MCFSLAACTCTSLLRPDIGPLEPLAWKHWEAGGPARWLLKPSSWPPVGTVYTPEFPKGTRQVPELYTKITPWLLSFSSPFLPPPPLSGSPGHFCNKSRADNSSLQVCRERWLMTHKFHGIWCSIIYLNSLLFMDFYVISVFSCPRPCWTHTYTYNRVIHRLPAVWMSCFGGQVSCSASCHYSLKTSIWTWLQGSHYLY